MAVGAEGWQRRLMPRRSRALPPSPFRRFNLSPEVIRLVVMMYVRFSLSLRNVEDLLAELTPPKCGENANSTLLDRAGAVRRTWQAGLGAGSED